MIDKGKFYVLALIASYLLVLFYALDSNYSVSHFALAWNYNLSDSGNSSNENGTSGNETSSNMTNSIPVSSPNVRSPTDGGSLDVMVQASPFPLKIGDSKFKITFLQASSEIIQVHVDYDVVISQSKNELFRASALTGQPLLHTAEGVVNIPYSFDKPGHYTLEVSVMGINFVPIRTESAKFDFVINQLRPS